MLLHGTVADDELLGDARVGAAFGHQPQHLALAWCEHRKWFAPLTADEQLGDDLGIQRGASVRNAAARTHELRDIGNPLLEEVADANRAAAEQLRCEALLDVLRKDEHRCSRPYGPQFDGRPKPLVGERRRHADVDDDEVGFGRLHGGEELARVRKGGHDLRVVFGQQAGDPFAEQH